MMRRGSLQARPRKCDATFPKCARCVIIYLKIMSNSNADQNVLRLKTIIVAIVAFFFGVVLLTVSRFALNNSEWAWLSVLPIGEVGGILVGAGLLGVAWDYFDGRDRERRDDARVRRLLKESAPDFRDAVVRGFAVENEDLQRVATPELLDDIASNALGLRLKDRRFAREIYTDLVHNVIRAPERWHDVDVRIRLSSIEEKSSGAPRFAVTVTWEYTVIPSSPVARFACTSDRAEFHELLSDLPATSTWFMTPRPGFDASDRAAYELLQYSIDGEELPIRRAARKSSQTYSVRIGDERVNAARPVRIRHVYRTITARSGHMLHVTLAQPAKGLTLSLDYTDTDVASMRVTDLISSSRRPRLARLPNENEAREITMDVPGWILPQAEVTFVWTLLSELPAAPSATPALPAVANAASSFPE